MPKIYRVPYVKKKPRARNRDGTWRKKRSDAGKKREKTMGEEPQFDVSKMIEAIRESTEEQLKWLMQNRGKPDDDISQPLVHSVLQTYLLTKMLETLDNINEKLAMANINIQDVEQAVLAQKEQDERQ